MEKPAFNDIVSEFLRAADLQASLGDSSFFTVDFEHHSISPRLIMQQAGYALVQTEVRTFRERIHPDDQRTFSSLWNRVLAGLENELRLEYRLATSDAQYLWVQTHCLVITRHADGSPAFMIGVDADINARKLNELNLQDELQETKARLRQHEHLQEAEKSLMADLDLQQQLDNAIRSARKVMHYDLLRVFRITDGEFELLGSDRCHEVDDRTTMPQFDPAVHGTSLARSTLAVPIPRIVELDGEAPPYRSWLGIPMLKGDKPFAILELFHHEVRSYRSEHIWTARTWAEHLARTILNNTRYQEIQSVAYKDSLSGLYNRRYIDHLMQDDPQFRNMARLSLMVLDLDQFKGINDRFGHDAGDAVIRTIARIMDSVFRQGDIPCRFGGDEFLVFLPATDQSRAQAVAERFRLLVSTTRIPEIDGVMTISCGVSTMAAFQPASYQDLFKAADQALYQAKQEGRNRVNWCAVPVPGK